MTAVVAAVAVALLGLEGPEGSKDSVSESVSWCVGEPASQLISAAISQLARLSVISDLLSLLVRWSVIQSAT